MDIPQIDDIDTEITRLKTLCDKARGENLQEYLRNKGRIDDLTKIVAVFRQMEITIP